MNLLSKKYTYIIYIHAYIHTHANIHTYMHTYIHTYIHNNDTTNPYLERCTSSSFVPRWSGQVRRRWFWRFETTVFWPARSACTSPTRNTWIWRYVCMYVSMLCYVINVCMDVKDLKCMYVCVNESLHVVIWISNFKFQISKSFQRRPGAMKRSPRMNSTASSPSLRSSKSSPLSRRVVCMYVYMYVSILCMLCMYVCMWYLSGVLFPGDTCTMTVTYTHNSLKYSGLHNLPIVFKLDNG